ncbi:IS6 family transposase [Halolamina sp. CBA1230]|uniref:IS6 family transposase n=1 Tax=Halolamina sp. CBA1230 TaxID=1853690 RepID=UPI0009A19216|nr:IS6 family transposase [Halolamina sp. CBA1230]QKY21236.1 IS6 family transposase [Halolamina sp. CBA1230]
MAETARLIGGSDCFELDFLEREATPESAMKLGIRLHLAGLSLSDTISVLDRLGVERCRTTVHNWVQKADLQPLDDANPDHVAVDETVIQLNNEQFWLYAAVDPDSNRMLHVKLSPTRNQAVTEMFLAELRDKHLVDDALFLVDSAAWLKTALHRHGLDYRYEKHGNRNSVERVFRELKRRTNQFSNCFSHAEADTVENWLQAFAFAWNQLI